MKKGIDFYLVGDYGLATNLTIAHRTFGMMDSIMEGASNETNPRDLIDFMLAAGDNMYPMVADHPTDWEFD